ncbi:MAG: SAM-dependent methyltransferase [Deltaproteobacteria bacterium]|nr:SAM-dependent methyltransferase [Deltaproteobacteria bacterium]
MKRRIETKTSKTAQWTCVSRAVSFLESDKLYRSNDFLALQLLPKFLQILLKIPLFRTLYRTVFSPKGIYEYVIARTRYIDTVFQQALADGFEQILIFGAGFDTRSIRFQAQTKGTTIFELDVHNTQNAKILQFQKRNIPVPTNLVFVAIDFEQETLVHKLAEAGFGRNKKSLFVLEGLLMYLHPQAVDETLSVIRQYAGPQSRIVFDYLQASVLRQENQLYGEKEIYQRVARAAEQWRSAIEPRAFKKFLASHSFRIIDHKNAEELEELYFKNQEGKGLARINGTHCLVTAEIV